MRACPLDMSTIVRPPQSLVLVTVTSGEVLAVLAVLVLPSVLVMSAPLRASDRWTCRAARLNAHISIDDKGVPIMCLTSQGDYGHTSMPNLTSLAIRDIRAMSCREIVDPVGFIGTPAPTTSNNLIY